MTSKVWPAAGKGKKGGFWEKSTIWIPYWHAKYYEKIKNSLNIFYEFLGLSCNYVF